MEGTEDKVQKGITESDLKMIALVTMLADHIGSTILVQIKRSYPGFLFEGLYYVLRAIGRIAFPIFCFTLVEGFDHTHDRKRYAARLFFFALISEIPFDFAFFGNCMDRERQNVFFTLLIGLIAMMGCYYFEKKKKLDFKVKVALYVVITVLAMSIAQVLHTDYGAMGIFSMMMLFLLRRDARKQIEVGVFSFLWEFTAPLAFIPISLYNGRRGSKKKYFFYLVYPLHLMILGCFCKICFS